MIQHTIFAIISIAIIGISGAFARRIKACTDACTKPSSARRVRAFFLS